MTRIEKTLQAMRRRVQVKTNVQACGRQFHVAIGEAAEGSVLTSIVDGLWPACSRPCITGPVQRAGLDQHEAEALGSRSIVGAIAGRNPNEARRAVRRHLQHVEEHLTSDDRELQRRSEASSHASRAAAAHIDREHAGRPVS